MATAAREPACLLNPVSWQAAAATEVGARRLRHLDALRARLSLAAAAGTMSTEVQLLRRLRSFGCIGSGSSADLCNLLSQKRESISDFALQVGHRSNGLLVLQFATDAWMRDFRVNCTSLTCSGGLGALGNNLGTYAMARAAAIAGNLDFVDVRQLCTGEQTLDLVPLLPAVAPAPRLVDGHVDGRPSAGNYSAAAERACHNFGHGTRAQQWQAYMPTFRRELNDGLKAWASCTAFPPPDEPLDDVAIALRCGDALGQKKSEYGVMILSELARLIPDAPGVRVGIVTQPHAAVCARQRQLGRVATVGDAARATFARGGRHANGHRAESRLADEPSRAAGWAADQLRTMHGVDLCACVCAALMEEVLSGLRLLRPRAIVSLRDGDSRVGALARLALAPNASVCVTSTFCMWPVLAAERGYIAQIGAFPKAEELASNWLPSLSVLPAKSVVRFSQAGGLRCDTSAEASESMRRWAQMHLGTRTMMPKPEG